MDMLVPAGKTNSFLYRLGSSCFQELFGLDAGWGGWDGLSKEITGMCMFAGGKRRSYLFLPILANIHPAVCPA